MYLEQWLRYFHEEYLSKFAFFFSPMKYLDIRSGIFPPAPFRFRGKPLQDSLSTKIKYQSRLQIYRRKRNCCTTAGRVFKDQPDQRTRSLLRPWYPTWRHSCCITASMAVNASMAVTTRDPLERVTVPPQSLAIRTTARWSW